jgi:hypothetical protein
MSTSTSSHLGFPIPGATINDKRLDDMVAVKAALTTIDASLANLQLGSPSAAVDLTAVNGDILPATTSVQNIGSPTKRFKGIYVDEAHLSVNTLYLGDTAVLGTNADVVNIKADPGQTINIKTTGVGSTLINSEHGISLQTNGTNADVVVQATGISSKVRFTAAQSVDITAPEIVSYGNHTVSGNESVGGDLTITGNLTVNGVSTVVNSQTVSTKDNIIEVNKGQVGSGVTAGIAGLTVNRGDAASYQMVFDETDDMFKVGMVGQLQTIASQNYVLASAAALVHVHAIATTSVSGFMSAADKTKLDGLTTSPVTSVAGKTGAVALAVSDIPNAGTLNLVQNIKASDYTCVLSDSGKHIFHPASDATSRTWMIPSNASVPYDIGTALTFVNRGGQVSINIASDTLYLAGTGATGIRALASFGACTALKINATEWIISGTGLS